MNANPVDVGKNERVISGKSVEISANLPESDIQDESPATPALLRDKSAATISTKPRSGILKSAGSRSKGSAGSQRTRFSTQSPDETTSRCVNQCAQG